jgi:hypothetical protein
MDTNVDGLQPIYPFDEYQENALNCNIQTIQETTLEFLYLEFSQYPWKVSKQVVKPMLLLDMAYQVVIVEIDCNAELLVDRLRLMRMTTYKPIVYVRFNPAEHLGKSCWSKTDDDRYTIVDIDEWYVRLGNLKNEIDYRVNQQSRLPFTTVAMYYDDPITQAQVMQYYHDMMQ